MVPILATTLVHHLFHHHILLLSTITITTFFLSSSLLRRRRNKPITTNSPPSPPALPLLGNLHQLGSLPHRTLRSLSAKHGPLMLLHLGRAPTAVVSSAEVAEEVMRTNDMAFASRPSSSLGERLVYGSCDVAFAPYGDYWRQARRICILHLLSLRRVQSFSSVRDEEVSLMVEKIRSRSRSGSAVNLSETIGTVTNDVFSRVALGRKYSGEYGFYGILAEYLGLLGSFPVRDFVPWLGWLDRLSGLDSRIARSFREVDDFLEEVLKEHEFDAGKRVASAGDRKECDDFVDVLLSLDEKDDTVGISLSRDNIKAIILDMFSGGSETTSTTLVWIMAELIRQPNTLKNLQEEVRGVVGCNKRITEEDLQRMKYMKAVIKEALRLHPPVPLLVPREAIEDTQLQGYDIPAGTQVMVNAWAIGRDASLWDRPEEFRPDRFFNNSIDFKGQHFQFIPFGAGRRGCPGVGFAMANIEHVLAHLIHHFDWELPDGMRGKVLDMSESPGIAVRRKSSLFLVAKPRLH